MGDKYSLSILNRHDDGTSTHVVWEITAEEGQKVRDMLQRPADVDGFITAEQAAEATRTTRSWLSRSNRGSEDVV